MIAVAGPTRSAFEGGAKYANLAPPGVGGALPPANDSFKLNLFPDTSMDGPAGIGQPASAAPAIMIDGGGTKALQASESVAIFSLPDQPWARRVSGVYSNVLL